MAKEDIKKSAETSLQKQVDRNSVTEMAMTRKEVESLLSGMKGQIAAALPKHITVEKMIRIALTAVSREPKLLKCTKGSLLGAIILSSQFGLEPNTPLGEAHILPFMNNKNHLLEAQFIIGYRGYQTMAHRAGEIEYITTDVVYDRDTFKYERGTNEYLSHIQSLEENRGKITAFYAEAHYKSGKVQFEIMPKHEVDKIRARSKSKNKQGEVVGPWVEDYVEMGKKTTIRRLAKRLDLSADFMKAVHLDEMSTRGLAQQLNADLTGKEVEVDFADMNHIEDSGQAEVVEEKPQPTVSEENQKKIDILEGKTKPIEVSEFDRLSGLIKNIKTHDDAKKVSDMMKFALENNKITQLQHNELNSDLEISEKNIQGLMPTSGSPKELPIAEFNHKKELMGFGNFKNTIWNDASKEDLKRIVDLSTKEEIRNKAHTTLTRKAKE